MNTIGKINQKLNRKLIEIVGHAEPIIPHIGIFACLGYFVFYIVWKYLIPQPYENLGLRTAGALITIPLICYKILTPKLRKSFPLYYIVSGLLMIPFFFFFMMLKNEWSPVWMMSALVGNMLLLFIVSDWLIISIMMTFGYALAHLTVSALDGKILYTHIDISYLPIFLFAFIGSICLDYRKRLSHDAQLSLIKSLGVTIAHEVRTPLNAVTCTIEAIKTMIPEKPANGAAIHDSVSKILTENLCNIHESIDLGLESIYRGNKIIDSILTSLIGGKINGSNFRHHSARQSIFAAIDSYSFSSPSEKSLICTERARDFEFFGDRDLLMHLLFNLLKNALYYRQNPDLRIDISTRSGEQWNTIVVKDTGPGIDSAHIEKLFTEFHTFGKPGGSGLGLSFCRKIAQSFGGKIECRSVVNEWTEFIISLPSCDSATVKSMKSEILGQKTVMVVDHLNENRMVMSKILTSLNCRCDEAESISTALDMAAKKSYDLIFIDVDSPGVNLEELPEWLKGITGVTPSMLNHYQSLPLIGMTSLTESDDRQCVSLAGMSGYLQRPIDSNRLLALIDRLFFIENETPKPTPVSPVHHASILVVDDDSSTRRFMTTILESVGYKVFQAEQGSLAIDILEREEIDLVLMDLEMPVMGGLEATKTIRNGSRFTKFVRYGTIPIIIVSGYNDEETVQEIMHSGANAHLGKPVRKAALASTVSELISRTGKEDREEASAQSSTLNAWDNLNSVEIIDRTVIDSLHEFGDGEFSQELVNLFIRDSKKVIDDLEQAYSQHDHQKAIRAIHILLGSAASIGASRVQAIASTIDAILAQGNWPEEDAWLASLKQAYLLTVDSLSSTAAQKRGPEQPEQINPLCIVH